MIYGNIQGVGRSGANGRVSRLVLGTNTFSLDREEMAFSILDAFVAAGGTTIDTAHIYRNGESEQVIGKWLRARGNRDGLVLVTKGAHPKVDMRDPFASDWAPRVTPAAIAEDLTESLESLGVGSIDLYLLHRDDPTQPVGPIMDALNAHLASGRVHALGASNWTHQRIAEANDYAERHGLKGFVTSSPQLSLAVPLRGTMPGTLSISGDYAALDWYKHHAVSILAWSSQSGGFFASPLAPGSPDLSPRLRNYDRPENWERWRRVREASARLGVTPTRVALAWVLCQDFDTYAVIGVTQAAHLDDALGALDVGLSVDEVGWLDLRPTAVEIERRRASA